ncbi:MAG: acetyl-CoA carboxylase biotin carboxyl carrier protein subunit [Bacteroidia bacterium]|nr:acetyl-CoA carboxylase biotin carboxyl carrier protein subunit [Bacteroidia bacterium]
MFYTVHIEGQDFTHEDKVIRNMDAVKTGPDRIHLIENGINYDIQLIAMNFVQRTMTVSVNGAYHEMSITDEYDQLLQDMGLEISSSQRMTDVRAPMPGLILDVMVHKGQHIKTGDELVILEAMKMENVLQAASDGTVKSVEVNRGDTVEKTQVLIELE